MNTSNNKTHTSAMMMNEMEKRLKEYTLGAITDVVDPQFLELREQMKIAHENLYDLILQATNTNNKRFQDHEARLQEHDERLSRLSA